MVSIWLTKVKKPRESKAKKRSASTIGGRSNRICDGRRTQRLIDDTAGCGWCAAPRDHAGRSRTARKEIRRPSACSGCKLPRGKEGRRGLRQRLQLYSG